MIKPGAAVKCANDHMTRYEHVGPLKFMAEESEDEIRGFYLCPLCNEPMRETVYLGMEFFVTEVIEEN